MINSTHQSSLQYQKKKRKRRKRKRKSRMKRLPLRRRLKNKGKSKRKERKESLIWELVQNISSNTLGRISNNFQYKTNP